LQGVTCNKIPHQRRLPLRRLGRVYRGLDCGGKAILHGVPTPIVISGPTREIATWTPNRSGYSSAAPIGATKPTTFTWSFCRPYSAGCAARCATSAPLTAGRHHIDTRHHDDALQRDGGEHEVEAAAAVELGDQPDRDTRRDEGQEIAHRIDPAAPGIGDVARDHDIAHGRLAVDAAEHHRELQSAPRC